MESGDAVMWCGHCARWFRIDEDHYQNVCRKCGMYLSTWRCSRCGHVWVPRAPERPAKVCPNCHSRYWNRTRVRSERR